MRNKVAIYGGFAGNETLLSQRNVASNPTALSGDLADNDAPNFTNYSDNSYNVVVVPHDFENPIDQSAILDGFIITGGNAVQGQGQGGGAGSGGGFFMQFTGDPMIRHCQFIANRADGPGGGAFCGTGTKVQFRHCRFANNESDYSGGGVWSAGEIIMANAVIVNNQADVSGGGVAGYRVPYGVFANCRVMGNESGSDLPNEGGGGMHVTGPGGSVHYINCLIAGNATEGNGGGLYAISNHQFISNCTIANNTAGEWGGGVFFDGANDNKVDNSIIWTNTASQYSQMYGPFAEVCYSDVEGNWTAASSCPGSNFSLNPNFVNPANGEYKLDCPSPCINSGSDARIPDDLGDVDDDDNETEDTPLDLAKFDRTVSTVDRGAYEYEIAPAPCSADITDGTTPGNQDGHVNVDDLLLVINQWYFTCPCEADAAPPPCGDNHVNVDDLLAVISQWGECGGVAGSMPETIQDCFDACNHLSGSAWQLCTEECINKVCENHPEECE